MEKIADKIMKKIYDVLVAEVPEVDKIIISDPDIGYNYIIILKNGKELLLSLIE